MLKGNKILCAKSGLNAQHGHLAHKCSKIFFSRTGGWIFMKLGMWHQGPYPIIVCTNEEPWMTLTYFTPRSILETGFYMGKSENNECFGNYRSLRPETWQQTTNEVIKV